MKSVSDNPFWRIYFKVTDTLEKAIEWTSAIAFFGILFATLLQVLFRFVFNSPIIWTEELARYLGIFVVMLASANALKHNEHIGIDVFVEKLPPSMTKPLHVFYSIAVIGVMGFLTYHCFSLTFTNFFTPTPAMRIPIGIPYAGMMLGCAVSTLAGVSTLIEAIFNIQPKNAEGGIVE